MHLFMKSSYEIYVRREKLYALLDSFRMQVPYIVAKCIGGIKKNGIVFGKTDSSSSEMHFANPFSGSMPDTALSVRFYSEKPWFDFRSSKLVSLYFQILSYSDETFRRRLIFSVEKMDLDGPEQTQKLNPERPEPSIWTKREGSCLGGYGISENCLYKLVYIKKQQFLVF